MSRILRRGAAALAAATLGLTVAYAAPATVEAAPKRPVYKGTVTICYAPTAAAPKGDQYLFTQWDIAAAVKAAGPSIGKVRIVKERYPNSTCYGEVSIWSSPDAWANNPKKPYDVYTYGESGVMWESQITLGDKVGAKMDSTQRHAALVSALKAGIPR